MVPSNQTGSSRHAVHFSSASAEWATPSALFTTLNAEFRFDLDVCATPALAKCARFFTPDLDGLRQPWTGRCWMNPPYGRTIRRWVEKAQHASRAGTVVVGLLPARVDTAWWWDYCVGHEIRFLKGRLRFGQATHAAPFPSAVVVFGYPEAVRWWDWRTRANTSVSNQHRAE
jgi:phage N-6-adenine-methyltransferase